MNSVQTRTAQHWYIAYTLPRHEKAIAQRLTGERLSCYVPLYSEARSWKQRRVQLELPLFPCYVFVRMHLEAKTSLLSLPGVVRLLAVSGAAVIFPDQEMEALQASLKRWSARPYPFYCSGKRIRLKTGPFAGLEGTILRRNGKRELIVNLDLIQSSMLLEIDTADAQLCI
jgi:transcription antitermination factor NusG